MKSFNEFINEGTTDYLKPKSDDNILKNLNSLSDNDKIKYIIKYQLDYNLLPRNDKGISFYKGYLDCSSNQLTELPDNLTINGSLICSYNQLTELPDNLTVGGNLFCNNNQLTSLPNNLTVGGNLNCSYNKVKLELPKNAKIKGNFYN